jgi:hypothetical protein
MKKSQARSDAVARGDKTYIPETTCARGHMLRSVSGTCIECRRLREKDRYYADPKQTKLRVKEKYQRHADVIKARRKAAYAANPEPEKVSAKIRSAEWRKLNPHHAGTKESKIVWKQKNPGKVRADTVKRRAAKLQRTPAWLTVDDLWMLEQAYELAALRTKMFGFSWHVDHIIPLQGKLVSGLHVPTNVRVIPGIENVRKANRYAPA